MKFSHGVWTMKEGVTSLPVARICRHEVIDHGLILYGVNRGEPRSNINNYGFRLRLSSPLEGTIRVQLSHRRGTLRPGPDFQIRDNLVAPIIEMRDENLVYRSGSLRVVIGLRPFTMEFYDGERFLTRSKADQLAVMTQAGSTETYVNQRLSLSVGELVYGMGERFGPLVRNGQSVSIWNEDPGTETDLAYKSIPFYFTNRGYGVFVNSPARVDFEVATERVFAVQFSVPERDLDYVVIAGPQPKDVLEKYTRLTGRPALPPRWSFGLWLSTSFLTDYDETVTGAMLDGMLERQIPVSVFHFDCLWMKEHHWCDFEWDAGKFPDPPAMLRRLKDRGVRICLWINPYISEFSRLFDEGRDSGYFVRDASGAVYQRDDWQPQIALVDFTNPSAVAWYQEKLRELMNMGVDCFKTDFGERIPADAVYHDGSDPQRMHNYYSYLYNQAVYDLLVAERGEGEAVLFARSATAGGQKFPVHWGGDCDATFESMAETLRGGISFGLSGGAFWSHDIGGFNATATPDLYKRWVAFGLLSSHSRLHGSTSFRVPWAFDEEACDVLRHFCGVKMRLMPYLWAMAVQAHIRGVPLLRAMALEFPEDPAVAHLEGQYMLGDSLLIVPVLNAEGSTRYYLPEGEYTDYNTGEIREGGRYYAESAVSYFRIPLLVRPDTLLCTGHVEDNPDYDYLTAPRLELFQLADRQTAHAEVHDAQGKSVARFTATREGDRRFTFRSTCAKSATILLRNIFDVTFVVSGTVLEANKLGTEIAWEDTTRELTITLAQPMLLPFQKEIGHQGFGDSAAAI